MNIDFPWNPYDECWRGGDTQLGIMEREGRGRGAEVEVVAEVVVVVVNNGDGGIAKVRLNKSGRQ